MPYKVARRKLAFAFTGALMASGVLATTALAAPTGSITLGPRISTGQLTAQFNSSSDVYDPQYGFGLSWFPYATLAAPGEPCIASSSAVSYVGPISNGPDFQSSGTEAFDADAGTLCLSVVAGPTTSWLAQRSRLRPRLRPRPRPRPRLLPRLRLPPRLRDRPPRRTCRGR